MNSLANRHKGSGDWRGLSAAGTSYRRIKSHASIWGVGHVEMWDVGVLRCRGVGDRICAQECRGASTRRVGIDGCRGEGVRVPRPSRRGPGVQYEMVGSKCSGVAVSGGL